MKRLLLIPTVALGLLALPACNVTSSQVAGIIISAQTIATAAGQQKLVLAAQQRVVQACGYLPTAQTIKEIATTFAPTTEVTLALVDTVATGICQAVLPTATYASGKTVRGKKKRGPPKVNGVPIRGQFVTKAP